MNKNNPQDNETKLDGPDYEALALQKNQCETDIDNPLFRQQPKGKLLIIGGHEDKGFVRDAPGIISKEEHYNKFDILSHLIDDANQEQNTIEVIAAASSIPDEMELMYQRAYKHYGFNRVNIINIDKDGDADNEEVISRVKQAHAVFFTGGDQLQLTYKLCGTALFHTIKERYYQDENFIVSGTSAGAMAMSQIIIGRGTVEEALLKEDLKLAHGFGFLNNIIVDTHFIKRGRFTRLALAVALHPDKLGIGLGEDAALMITNGNECQSMGSGSVIIIDGSGIKASNAENNAEDEPVSIEHLKVNIIAYGSKYFLKEKRMVIV